MTPAELHDAAVDRLAARLAELFPPTGRYAVRTRLRCQLLDGFPDAITTFDVAVVAAGLPWLATPDGPVLGPDGSPYFGLNVVTADTLSVDMVAVPNILVRSGIPEYVLFDPTGDVLRPALQAFWSRDGELRRGWTPQHGVFFSGRDFRLDVRGPELVVSRCGRGRVEEELFVLRWERDRLGPADAKRAGYDRRITQLEGRRLAPRAAWEDDEP